MNEWVEQQISGSSRIMKVVRDGHRRTASMLGGGYILIDVCHHEVSAHTWDEELTRRAIDASAMNEFGPAVTLVHLRVR